MNSFRKGLKDGLPIGFGYFAVAFSLGIIAAGAGLTPFQGFLASLLVNASAGENAAFIAIKESVPYLQMVMIMIVSNIRYVLMSFALSQKIRPGTALIHRLILGFFLTDEYFALAVSQDPYCDPYYSYGAISFAAPCWASGTALGIVMGNILPGRIVSALSVALFGMFLAIIIPPARTSRPIAILIVISFISSYLLNTFTSVSESTATIILTIALSSLGAILFPVKGDNHAQ
ncbi:MAG: AzlC family ABC transporter permease [Oscillospiraceae bacterium]|nr:AzlC family ABC transporter permease [Oscillospiraceae bacterium]MBQ6493060.1 AzlC family ABC transporter permease [Erysipelotrichaceae bacterium]